VLRLELDIEAGKRTLGDAQVARGAEIENLLEIAAGDGDIATVGGEFDLSGLALV
jgi:hypothetical protein